jgi:hypothetical protein
MSALATLLALIEQMTGWSGPEGWRARRASLAKSQKPTYDAYPDTDIPPDVSFYVEARDARGRLRRAYVDLDGYAVNQLNWAPGATRGGVRITDWFCGRMLRALRQLNQELNKAREEKERKEFNYDPRTGSR